jgi:hypothetical protein
VWAERILQMSPDTVTDPNQNSLFAVETGLTNYGYLNIVDQIEKL